MKKYVYLSLALSTLSLSGFAVEKNLTSQSEIVNIQVINLANLTENDLKEIMAGKCPNLAVEFTAQTTLPISFFLQGDLINLIDKGEKWVTAEVKQTFYMRCNKEGLFFSSNLTEWKPFLEFITGTASITLSIQDGQPSIVVGSETNLRP